MSVGERLKAARRMAGLSQRALAEQSGVSATTISKYERNLAVPRSSVLIRLAQALGVKVEYFLRPHGGGTHLRDAGSRTTGHNTGSILATGGTTTCLCLGIRSYSKPLRNYRYNL